MNRATFFGRLGLITGIAFSSSTLLMATNTHRTKSNNLFFNKSSNAGFEPVIYKTPWGQKVIYDRYTFSDMKTGEWTKEGLEWAKIETLQKELNNKIDNNEIVFTKGPAKLVDGLWQLVLDGQQNSFLIETETGLILVDPGMESNTKLIVKQIEILGYNQSDVKYILLTHCHVDHAHSANYWQKLGAEIHIHQLGENPIRTGNEITAWYLIDGDEREFPKVEGEISIFHDGDKLNFGDLNISVCHTPGHTPDSCCFYFRKEDKNILIGGDTIFHNGKHGWMGHPYSDYEQYLKSLWKLNRFAVGGKVHNEKDRIMVRNPIAFDFLLHGHTAISMENVTRDIDKGIEIMSYTLQQRRKGIDYQWTEPYTFFAEREIANKPEIKIEYK
ncbi:MAG: MBL fold metallo-hydrolase [Draconibacterium sp.]|nr:MBL fold metallo-hydrolase [Draconibacterium sp.]